MGGGALQRILDAVPVIVPVGFLDWRPGDFFGENGLAIDHRGAFAVAAAEIEADTAAVPVASDGNGGFPGSGAFVGLAGGDSEGFAKYAVSHEIGIKGAGAARRIFPGECSGELRTAADPEMRAALLPEQGFQQTFDVAEVDCGGGVGPGKNRGVEAVNRAVRASESQVDWRWFCGGGQLLQGFHP